MLFHLTFKAFTDSPVRFMKCLSLPALLAVALACPAFAAEEAEDTPPFVEGVHYTRIPLKAGLGSDSDKIEVREFFWYGCPHCHQLEPYIGNWKVADDVEFIQTPATLGRNWVPHAYTYYALESLGKVDELHPVFFDALHIKKLNLQSFDQISKFFSAHGIEEEKFAKTVRSFLVEAKVKHADKLSQDYELSSVPTFIVNGHYSLSPSTVGSYEKFTDALDYLVGLERKRLGKNKS